MNAKHYLEFRSLTGGCTGSSKSALFEMPHCWKSHVTAHILFKKLVFFSNGGKETVSKYESNPVALGNSK